MARRPIIDRQARDMLIRLLQDVLDGRQQAFDVVETHFPSWSSSDGATYGVFDELERVAGVLDGDDCGRWTTCDSHCVSCRKPGISRDLATRSRARREIARAIEFLKTDLPYRWDEGMKIPWYLALPAAVVLLFGMVICFALAFALSEFLVSHGIKADGSVCIPLVCITFALLWLGSFTWLGNKCLGKDRRYWPFYGRKEWEAYRQMVDPPSV